MVPELSAVEKALSKNDLGAQKAPLEAVLKALRPLKLKSIDQLDMGTKGRLITTLLRVGRQQKPQVAAAPAAPAPEPQAEPAPILAESPAEAPTEEAPTEVVPAELAAQPTSEPQPEEPPAPSPRDEKTAAYQEVLFLVGSIWRAAGDERRAALAFAASGRSADQVEAVKTLERTGDWTEQAAVLESGGQTREAARIHEKNRSFAEAARLFEAGADRRAALRCALSGKDTGTARRILGELKPEESRPVLEKAGAWELLMERYVEAKDYEGVAKLYERARQFDQAALAWERAGKLANAKRAYERAGDAAGAARLRLREASRLVERGDRLGAAVLLVSAGERRRAAEVLAELPPVRAFHFMQKAKLDQEALELARKQIARAEEEKKPADKARWLELVGELAQAADAWLAAERKDKALAVLEEVGNWQRAAEVAEALGQYRKAVELFHRAGDKANAERVAALPEPLPAAPAQPAPAKQEQSSA